MEGVISRYGCERSESVQQRVVKVVRDLEVNGQGKTLLLVSHADPIQALMAAFAGLDPSRWERIVPLGYAELAQLYLGMPLRIREDGKD